MLAVTVPQSSGRVALPGELVFGLAFEFWSAPDTAFTEELPESASLFPHRLFFLLHSTVDV